jgi:hypothetical protein
MIKKVQSKILISLYLLLLLTLQSFGQQQDKKTLTVENIDNYFNHIEKQCKIDSSTCSKSYKSGYVRVKNHPFGLYKLGNFIEMSSFHMDTIFNYSTSLSINLNKNNRQYIHESYYFINYNLVKYVYADSIFKEKENIRTLNHKIVFYIDQQKIINQEAIINDNFKLTDKEIQRIFKFSNTFKTILIR